MLRLQVVVPDHWNEWSLDLKLFAIFEGVMFLGILLGDGPLFAQIGNAVYYGTIIVLALVLFLIAKLHREFCRWRWPGFNKDAVLITLVAVIAIGALFYFTLRELVLHPRYLALPRARMGVPGVCAAGAFFLYILLEAANVVQRRKSEFEQNCRN